jgi:hypothetical protein
VNSRHVVRNFFLLKLVTLIQALIFSFSEFRRKLYPAIIMSDDNLSEVLIVRLKSLAAKPNDNVGGLRSVAARLHSRAASQGMSLLFLEQ